MKIAVVQLSSTTDPQANLNLLRDRLPDAAGADLVVFPEATMASFATRSAAVAEPLDGPFAEGVSGLAREFGTTLAVGMFTPARARERCRNTLFVTGPGGEVDYAKLHLFDALGFRESDHVEPGERPVLAEVAGTRVGLALCYDVRFPALFQHYADAGADVILVPASWQAGPGKVDQWRTLVQARALDATAYVVGCGQAAPEASGGEATTKAPLGVGHSLVVGPDGRILAEAGSAPEVLVVDVDPDAVRRVRQQLPVLANARFRTELRPA